jgi:hypothetical protein
LYLRKEVLDTPDQSPPVRSIHIPTMWTNGTTIKVTMIVKDQ